MIVLMLVDLGVGRHFVLGVVIVLQIVVRYSVYVFTGNFILSITL